MMIWILSDHHPNHLILFLFFVLTGEKDLNINVGVHVHGQNTTTVEKIKMSQLQKKRNDWRCRKVLNSPRFHFDVLHIFFSNLLFNINIIEWFPINKILPLNLEILLFFNFTSYVQNLGIKPMVTESVQILRFLSIVLQYTKGYTKH